MTADSWTTARENAEVLFWQARIRVVVAIVAGVAALVLQRTGVLQGSAALLLSVTAAYLGTVTLINAFARRWGGAGNLLVASAILCDIVFIFSTIASSSVVFGSS